MKTNTQKVLNLKQARHSSALNQCQSVDSPCRLIAGFMRIALLTALALGLMSNPYYAHAETNAVTSYLQEIAESNAQELGGVITDENWTRIEFSKMYVDPVVVVEGSVANANNPYVVGVRNVDAMGFEILHQSCNYSTGIPDQEHVNYSVIDRSQLPVAESSDAKVRQVFSWGECPVVADNNWGGVMKMIDFMPLVMKPSTANMVFAADEIHWTFTGPNSVAFYWRGPNTENTIGYGLTSGVYTQVNATTPNPVPVSCNGPFWKANLTGLMTNTRYYYKIGNGPERSFRTPPAPGSSDFNVYALSNMGSSSTYFNTGAVQDIIDNDLPAFVVGLGDLTLGGLNGKATIDQHFNDVMAWSKEAAYMPVWGDLDCISSGTDNFKNYKGRFAVPNPQTSPGSPLAGGKDWYWFDYGNTRFITLPEPWSGAWSAWNTTAGDLMAQAQADPNIKFIATFGHRPAYSSGHYTGSPTLKGMLDRLGDTYSKYILNINGHSNNYERSFPQHGVTHVTVGTGGANLTQDGTCLWLTCAKPAWSAFRAMHLGALKLRFADEAIQGAFICGPAGGGKNDVNCTEGSVVDNFTIASPTVTVVPSSSVAPMATTVAPMATALPDVIVTSLSYSKGIFTCTVKNQGTAATPTGVIVGVKYSDDGVGKTWGNFMGPLAKGASVTIGTTGPAYTFPDGTHTITAYVDDVNRFKESNETNNKLSGTLTVDTSAPTVPTGLSAVAASATQINLSWKASTDKVGVAGYKIFRDGVQVGTSAKTTYSDLGLTPITSYNYTVSAYDKAGNTSGKSTSVTAKTKRDYRFDGSISLPVLQNYLSRSLHMMRFGEGVGDSTDNIRMITNTGAKYLGRAFHPFGYEDLFISRLATTRDMIVRTHAADPDIIFEGGMFEYASTKINTIAVPAWVFQAFNLPVVSRNFIQADMVFPTNPILPDQPYTMPDITKTETQMWFYFMAISQIDAGLESLNWGYYAMYASSDAPSYPILYNLVAKVRAYAKAHSRRHWVLMNAGGNVSVGGKLMFDFSGANLHGNGVSEVVAEPCKAILTSKYNGSGAGITPSGWSTTRLPFLVHIDNRGFSGSACTAGLGGSWLWGWDEISWFANQPEAYRNEFLRYADNYINNTFPDNAGHLEMPGIRKITPNINGSSNYFANSTAFYSLGFNQEETIRQIWSLDP